MKYKLLFSFIIILVYCQVNVLSAQNIYEEISLALKAGDNVTLSRYIIHMVEISIDDKNDMYSKNQASQVIKTFFQKNTPVNFTIRHEGSSAKGLPYLIGDLKTRNSVYRTYILFKEIDGKYYIQEIQFEKE